MAANLPSLPIELLLNIVCCAETGSSSRKLCEALRLTCKQLDSKIVRYFGNTHYKRIKLAFSETGLNRLLRISRGPLAHHIESVTIQCGTVHPFRDVCIQKDPNSLLDENISKWLKDGDCAEILASALSKLPNLSGFHIRETGYNFRVDERKQLELLWTYWATTLRTLLGTAIPTIRSLEELSICANSTIMAADPSHLGDIITLTNQLGKLRMLHIDMVLGTGKDNDAGYIRNLCSLLRAAAKLDDLYIGFGGASHCDKVFESINQSLNLPTLRRLSFSNLKTTQTQLEDCLRPIKDTLKILCLEKVWTRKVTWPVGIVRFIRKELNLEEVTIRQLGLGDLGLYLRRFHQLRPSVVELNYEYHPELTDEGWAYVDWEDRGCDEVTLKYEDGDDIKYWLRMIEDVYKLKAPWGFDGGRRRIIGTTDTTKC